MSLALALGHCLMLTNHPTRQSLAPKYELLADAYAHAKDKVIIAKVDSDGVGKPLGRMRCGIT